MTQNVAEILADLLRSVDVPGGEPPQRVWGFSGQDDLEAWRTHVHAVNLVRQVDETIDRLETQGRKVSVYRRALPQWYAAVGFAKNPWGHPTQNLRDGVDEHALDILDALGTVLDGRPHVELSDQDTESLILILEQAWAMVEGDVDLPSEIRAYLMGLLRRAKFVLRHLSEYGAEAAREVLLELGGALHARADVADEGSDAQTGWRKLGKLVTNGFVTTVGAGAAKQLGEHSRKMIEAAEKAVGDVGD